MNANLSGLTDDMLHEPSSAIAYHLSRRLDELFSERALREGEDPTFGVEAYGAAGQCAMSLRPEPYPQLETDWAGPKQGIVHRGLNVWYDVSWQGNDLTVIILHWGGAMGEGGHRHYVLAETAELADQFIAEVCRWNSELRDEVLVFEGGHWHKDPALFRAIKGATLDNLVLRGDLKEEIHRDLAGFFQAQETYQRYGVPWKRGVLFVGPPGNGKTHAVKALINALGQDCLYVKSFRAQVPDEYNIHSVFARARMSAPCVLVLEDLDSLITNRNRSFFLNELDGFAGNDGILTLATTNHPERLDPAVVDRPSRFDRKYPFDLPTLEERKVYVKMWNDTLQPELRLSDAGILDIAAGTDEFSFAYLKELFISATMRWINAPGGAMDAIMPEQVETLRGQMASAIDLGATVDGDRDEMGPMARMEMRHAQSWLHMRSHWEPDFDVDDEEPE